MSFFDWLMEKSDIPDFSMEDDMKRYIMFDYHFFPTKEYEYQPLLEYMISRQNEIPTFFSGYPIEETFSKLFSDYEKEKGVSNYE